MTNEKAVPNENQTKTEKPVRKQIFTQIKEALYALQNSESLNNERIYIPWKGNKGFSVECMRADRELVEDLEIDPCAPPFKIGDVIEFSVYYQVNGKDVDSCRLPILEDKEYSDQIKELIRMYK